MRKLITEVSEVATKGEKYRAQLRNERSYIQERAEVT
jgi:hypothetical protein